MKKILIIIVTLLMFFSLSSKNVLAAFDCCIIGYESNGKNGCYNKFNLATYFTPFPDRCNDATEECDLASQVCLPKGSSAIIDSTTPKCPQNYTDITDPINILAPWDTRNGRACCKSDILGQLVNPFTVKDKCTNPDNLAFGKICPNVTYRFDPPSGKCVRYNATLWSRNNTTCTVTQADGSTVNVDGFDTAIGCVPTGDIKLFLTFVLKYAFFASGAIILLLIISTGYTIITSSGNPEKLQGAQENIIALFSGLALIAFSLILLQVIGADILNLKAFQ